MKQAGLLRIFSRSFRGEADEAMRQCREMRHRLLQCPPGIETFRHLDDISNEMCRVTDSLELLRNVLPCPNALRDANDTHQTMSEYIFALNADKDIYRAITRALKVLEGPSGSAAPTKDCEMLRFGQSMKAEYDKGGINLPAAQRERLGALQSRELELGTLFAQNLADVQSTLSLPHELVMGLDENSRSALDSCRMSGWDRRAQSIGGITAGIGGASGSSAQEGDKSEPGNGGLLIRGVAASSPPFLVDVGEAGNNTLGTWVSSSEVRRRVMDAHLRGIPENKEILHQLLQVRHEISADLGYESHAHFSTAKQMALTPRNVRAFIDDTADSIRDAVADEFRVLAKLKQADHGGGDIDSSGGSVVVDPWDVKFYTMRAMQILSTHDEAEVGRYLSVGGCLRALNAITRALFQVEMVLVTNPRPDEVWHTSVEKMALVRCDLLPRPADWSTEGDWEEAPPPLRVVEDLDLDNEDVVGICYLDLFARDHKYAQAAHFTVQCARKRGSAADLKGGMTTEQQLPIVALVFAFDPQQALSLTDVEVVFHEFGHAMHSLLSETQTQHLSGTRGPLDFVETPSHLWEHFAWDPRIMGLYARHNKTGEPMPMAMRRSLLAQSKRFQALGIQSQIFMAAADLEVHSSSPHSAEHTSNVCGSLRERYTSFAHMPGTHWETRFGHLVWYGGGYYSYLWSQVYARSIWQHCLARDPLCSDAGAHLLGSILKHGAARCPNDMMKDALGGKPLIKL